MPPEEPGAGAGNAGSDGAVVAAWEAPRAVPVEVVTAVKKKVPVRIDLLGTVTPIASVAVKTRVDTQVKGARVMDSQSILESGLEGGELVVTEGQV